MTAVRSRRLFGPTTVAAGGTVNVYTVPAARTAVIRTLSVHNLGGLAAKATLSVNGAVMAVVVPGAGLSEYLPDDLILNPGDILAIANGAATGSMQATAGGSLLDGAPS